MKDEIKCVGSKVSVVFTETSPFWANSVRYVDFYNNELEALTESLIQEDVLSLRIKNERLEKENAYLTGLKAGKPKWHKVADGDLPKNEGFVCNQDGLPCWFDIKTDQWLDCEGTQIRTTEWCEMPRFKE